MERETNSIRIKRFSFSNDLLKLPNVARKFSRIRLAKRHIRVKHPFEGKDHIFGVEIARGFEPRRGMELHTAPEIKSIGPAVRGNVPPFGETRFDFVGIFKLVFKQPVKDRCPTALSETAIYLLGSNPVGLASEQYTRDFIGNPGFVKSFAYAPQYVISSTMKMIPALSASTKSKWYAAFMRGRVSVFIKNQCLSRSLYLLCAIWIEHGGE